MRTHTHTPTHTHTHAHTDTHTHTHTRAHTYTHTRAHTRTHARALTNTHTTPLPLPPSLPTPSHTHPHTDQSKARLAARLIQTGRKPTFDLKFGLCAASEYMYCLTHFGDPLPTTLTHSPTGRAGIGFREETHREKQRYDHLDVVH